jgi:NAD(P)-dependent dehydrogenase (short-subunit alcohol dehydrogenase family)
VFICARDEGELRVARAELESRAGRRSQVASAAADVSDPDDVEELVGAVLDRFDDLTILVNNAGVYGPKGPIEEVDWTAWVRSIAINLMGSVLPARALIPHLKRVSSGRVIQLSSGGARSPLPASDGINGKLLSAAWDPWQTLQAHRDELNSDV